jgi:hypothetical protein
MMRRWAIWQKEQVIRYLRNLAFRLRVALDMSAFKQTFTYCLRPKMIYTSCVYPRFIK